MVVNKEDDIPYMKEYNNKINNNKDIYNKIMSYDNDGVMFWNVEIYESVSPSKEE